VQEVICHGLEYLGPPPQARRLDPQRAELARDEQRGMRVPARVFVVDVSGHPKARTCHGPFALCNAEVVSASRWEKGREGCMSVPDLTGDVRRAANLVVAGVAPGTGEPVEIRTDAFEARALQHEIDHCAGLLFLDRVAGAHAVYARKTYL